MTTTAFPELRRRQPTPPDKLCRMPHGLPCLAHRGVMLTGTLQPCDNCAPHKERVAAVLNLSRPTTDHHS